MKVWFFYIKVLYLIKMAGWEGGGVHWASGVQQRQHFQEVKIILLHQRNQKLHREIMLPFSQSVAFKTLCRSEEENQEGFSNTSFTTRELSPILLAAVLPLCSRCLSQCYKNNIPSWTAAEVYHASKIYFYSVFYFLTLSSI